jgi:hypothetical protein
MVVGTSETDDGFRRVKNDEKAVNIAENLGERMASIIKKLNK